MECLQPCNSYKQRFRRLTSLIELPYPPKQPPLVPAGRCPVPGSGPHAPVDPACERGQAESPTEGQQYRETGEDISCMGLLRPWWPHSDAALKGHFCSVPPSNEDITPNAAPLHSRRPTPTPTPTPTLPRTWGFLAKVIHPPYSYLHIYICIHIYVCACYTYISMA